MILRSYQQGAIDGLYNYFTHKRGNPLVVMPTGSGKSFVIAAFIKGIFDQWPDQRILMITHRKELIQQNADELRGHWPEAPIGIYSAGLNKRDTSAPILFCGIQSVYSKAELIGWADLILVDECHLVPRNSNTMYRKFLDDMLSFNKNMKIIGFTATHYRLDSGLLTEGDDRIFTDIAYNVDLKELINNGYLAPLVNKKMTTEYNLVNVKIRGGDYIQKELAAAMDINEKTEAAVNEIIEYGVNRKSWLIFCAGVDHAIHTCEMLNAKGIKAAVVHGGTPQKERDQILYDYKRGEYRALVNCDVLTTGFNHKGIDLLGFLKPTESAALYVQMAGRGMRIEDGKIDCVVLDFAGNVERHGAIDLIDIKAKKRMKEAGVDSEAPTKTCPECESIIFVGTRQCPDCGYVWETQPIVDLKPTASEADIISSSNPIEYDVEHVEYFRHSKKDKPDSVRVEYFVNFYTKYSEWVCPDHGGYATTKAHAWFSERLKMHVYHIGDKFEKYQGFIDDLTTDRLLSICHDENILPIPKKIVVQKQGKYDRIIKCLDFYFQDNTLTEDEQRAELEYSDDLPF